MTKMKATKQEKILNKKLKEIKTALNKLYIVEHKSFEDQDKLLKKQRLLLEEKFKIMQESDTLPEEEKKMMKLIKELEDRLGRLIPENEIYKECKKLKKKDIDEILNQLVITSKIYKPRMGFVQRM